MTHLEEVRELLQSAYNQAAEAIFAVPPGSALLDKGGGDFATKADMAANTAIRGVLDGKLDGAFLLTEEEPHTHDYIKEKKHVVVVDPLDGTHIYKTRSPDWGIILVALEDGRPVVAVVGQPQLGHCFSAIEGGGCKLNGQPFSVIRQEVLENQALVLAIPISHARNPETQNTTDRIADANLIGTTRCVGCAAGNTVEVLFGRCHAYINATGGKVWDLAGPQLILQEAGGMATGLSGKDLCWTKLSQPVIFSSDFLVHQRLLAALADSPT